MKKKKKSALSIYFHKHPVQRLIISLLAAVIICSTIGIIAYPHYREYRTIYRLGDSDPQKRLEAKARAIALAKDSPRMVERLQAAMASADDMKFLDIADVLSQLNKFYSVYEGTEYMDRLQSLNFAKFKDDNDSGYFKYYTLANMVISSRDNKYTRQTLSLAAADKNPEVRIASAVLAAKFGDDKTLSTMLADPEPDVAASAAMDAGLANMKQLAEKIAEKMKNADDPELLPACAYTLARFDANKYSHAILQKLRESTIAERQESTVLRRATVNRLLYVASMLNNDDARVTVNQILESYAGEGKFPHAMAMFAAGRLKIPTAPHEAIKIVREAAKRSGTLREVQLLAALDTIEEMDVPALKDLYDLSYAMLDLYNPNLTLSTCQAVRMLGKQAVSDQAGKGNCPTLEKCVELLKAGSRLEQVIPTSNDKTWMKGYETITIPEIWAASAAAYWMISPNGEYLMHTPTEESEQKWELLEPNRDSSAYCIYHAIYYAPETIDYLAWHIGRSGKPEATQLAKRFLPPLNASKYIRENSTQIRVAGGMIMAIANRNSPERSQLLSFIEGHEKRRAYSRDFQEYRSYTCDALILGEKDRIQIVQSLLTGGDIPQLRSAIALSCVGDKAVLDWILWKGQIPFETVCKMLTRGGWGEIISAASPSLPQVDNAAEFDVQLWQARILQDYYGIHRDAVEVKLP